jgi:Amt family ammonium transporter
VTTNTATSAAGLTWALIEWQKNGKPTVLGIASGALAGLVAITPACGFVSPLSSIIIGIMASVFCYLAVAVLKPRLGYDDALDVFGIHGVGGMWGTMATGLFASTAINSAGADGLLFGNLKLFLVQGLYLAVCIAYAVIMTWILFKFVDALFCMRVTRQDELVGLDLSQHHESAYTVLD